MRGSILLVNILSFLFSFASPQQEGRLAGPRDSEITPTEVALCVAVSSGFRVIRVEEFGLSPRSLSNTLVFMLGTLVLLVALNRSIHFVELRLCVSAVLRMKLLTIVPLFATLNGKYQILTFVTYTWHSPFTRNGL